MEFLGFPLSPKAVRSGTGFSDRCPAHDDRHNSLSLGTGREGQLLIFCHAGCSFNSIVEATRLVPPAPFGVQSNPSARRSQEIRDQAAADRKLAISREIWDSCRPIDGTIGEAYLASRGIRQGFQALRFNDALLLTEDGQNYPCIVAKVERGDEMVGIHRTYLTANGEKKTRRMLGACNRGAVRLSDGPLGLVVAEGIETALSAMALYHPNEFSVWAALSANGMEALQLPHVPSSIRVYADGEDTGVEAALDLAFRAGQFGWQATTIFSKEMEDLNDLLMEREGLK
jgi:hypothetical protein